MEAIRRGSWCRKSRHWSGKPASRPPFGGRLGAVNEQRETTRFPSVTSFPSARRITSTARLAVAPSPTKLGSASRRQSRAVVPTCAAVRRGRGSCAACRVLTGRRELGFALDGHALAAPGGAVDRLCRRPGPKQPLDDSHLGFPLFVCRVAACRQAAERERGAAARLRREPWVSLCSSSGERR